MCETRDLGVKWPQRHTLLSEGQEAVDMRVGLRVERKEDASETSQNSLLEEMDRHTRE